MVYSPPDFSVCGNLQARILEWVAFPPSSGSSRPREAPVMLKQTTENVLFNCDYTRFILEISSSSEHSTGNYRSCIYVMDWKFWVPRNLVSWSLNPHCDDIWRWELWEFLRWNWCSSKQRQEISCFPLLQVMWGDSKETTVYEPGRILSSDTESASTLILNSPAFRTGRNKTMLL